MAGRAVLLLAGTALAPLAAWGQAAPTQPSRETVQPADPVQDEQPADIVVTAQKREQRVQDVPIAVQVLSGDALQAQGVRDFADLTKAAPSLVVRPAEKPLNASVSIRGIGTFAFLSTAEQKQASVAE